MQITTQNWHIIYFEEFKYNENPKLKEFIDNKNYEKITEKLTSKTILVLWWDWTMLWAVKEFLDLNYPFLWFNFWTKWFLLNDINFCSSLWFVEKVYPVLENTLTVQSKKETFYSFNEVDIRAWNWRVITLEISLKSKKSINISWDWILVSTPVWSTWYNNSLGWPVIPHDVKAFVITPKAPFIPKWQSPIIVSQDDFLTIKNIWRRNTLQIYSDSNLVYEWDGESLIIETKKSDKKITFLISKDYYDTWENKVFLEQWFN